MEDEKSLVPLSLIQWMIFIVRGQRVILDSDLAALYGVTSKRLNEQVKRNLARFPEDFMFQLTEREVRVLRSQFATSKGRGGRRYLPYAFTGHGAIMAANVLNSDPAVEASVYVVRAFVKVREVLSTHKELSRKLIELESRLDSHDQDILTLVTAIRQLMEPPPAPAKKIGFRRGDKSRD